ncbi:MAG TPA: sigma-70 family RNA polymerase sigma factor [Candidatus Saccharimonadales bacterium]|nr:sigma-70 family RNA polymerase sigma factor [Candidatus Saccharimonadales bacterium]
MTVEDVYDLHADKVYKFFYIKCLDKAVAEDLTSQTFMALVERMQGKGPVIADHKKFLYGTMRNIWLMHLRKKYQQNEQSIASIEDFESYIDAEVEEYESLTIKQRAEVFINQLPERQKEVVSLRLLEDQSIKDIAALLQKDRNYVKTTYKRGLKRLKGLVEANASVMKTGKESV